MQHEYYERISDMAKNFQGPLGDIVKLNLETIQKFSYVKPDEIMNSKNPEKLISKQIEVAFDNMHTVIDYWQNILLIGEETSRNYLNQAQNIVEEAKSKAQNVGKGKKK